jgi:hypothetical protein
MTSDVWKKHRKHVFILSNAGKPIYCRYGDESKLVGFVGVLSGLISFVGDREDDSIQSITTQHRVGHTEAPLTMVFKTIGPIWLVIASRSGESVLCLTQQLVVLHAQILSMLTSTVHKHLISNPRLDIRNLLVGTDKYMDNLCSWMNRSPSFLLNSVHGFRLSSQLRLQIGNILLQHRQGELFYAIMLARGQLVQLLRPKSYILYPPDLHLIINFVTSSDSSFRTSEAQWTPICLPMFNDRGFLHQHVSYLNDNIALLLLSANGDDFEVLRECNDKIYKSLKSTGALESLNTQVARQHYSVKDTGVDGLLHFVYKSLSTSQMTAPVHTPPYTTVKEQKRLYRLYEHVHSRVHMSTGVPLAVNGELLEQSGASPLSSSSQSASSTSTASSTNAAHVAAPASAVAELAGPALGTPHKVYYHISDKETIIAWVTTGFELYATFGPLEQKSVCIKSCNMLLKWIKQEENNLFIQDSPVW